MDAKINEMKLKIFLIIGLVGLAFSSEILACSCAANPPFLTVAPKTQTIALVKIRRYLTYDDHPHGNTYVTSMETEIEEIYQGKEARKKITIRGHQGSNCLEDLTNFRINESYIAALFEGRNSEGKPTDYYISNCGEYWLSVDSRKEFATGFISETQKTIKLSELKNKLKESSQISALGNFYLAPLFSPNLQSAFRSERNK